MPLEEGGRYTRKELFNVGYDRNSSREPCNLPHVKPRREDFLKKKLSLLCNFSATAAISPISFHKSKSSPESPYRAVV